MTHMTDAPPSIVTRASCPWRFVAGERVYPFFAQVQHHRNAVENRPKMIDARRRRASSCLLGSRSYLPWRPAVSNLVKVIVLILAGLTSMPAQAQILGWTWESNIPLTHEDFEIIRQTVDQQVHGKPIRTTASWSNPNSGTSGTMKLLKKYTYKNMRCETIQYSFRTTKIGVSPERYVLDSCLTPEGWKIAG
jgi:hypothetical protein